MLRAVAFGFSFVLVATIAAAADVSGGATVDKAVAVVQPTHGNEVHGVVRFERSSKGVKVTGELEGLAPGEHGFHVHQYGDCSGPDGKTAGDHWNPHGKPHGAPGAAERHVGDLGNVRADDSGKAKIDAVDDKLRLDGSDSIVGRAVIVHAKPDDLKTQPTGNAGDRVGCGVVGVAKP
jgi:Cu-Zn family superoxide dismutase